VEGEVLKDGGAGVAGASRIHTACVSLAKHLEAEKRISEGGASMTLDAWAALTTASLRWKETVDRALKDLGLRVRPEKEDWYGEFLRHARLKDERRLAETDAAGRSGP
jgi:hypothetical protein